MAAKKLSKPSQAYKGNGAHAWEVVTKEVVAGRYGAPLSRTTSRLRVPGGYLYRVTGFAMSFVPMPGVVKHKV